MPFRHRKIQGGTIADRRKAMLIRDVLEYLGLSGIILMISLVSLTKMVLGAILTLIGAFLPSRQSNQRFGQANVKVSKATAAFKGSIRYGVIVAGIILIIGSIIDGVHDSGLSIK